MVRICDDERGLLFKRGNYVKHLKPGTYFYPFGTVVRLKLDEPFSVPGKPIQLFLKDEELLQELTVIDVKDHELAIHYKDGKFAGVYTSGTYAFWNALHEHRFITVDTRNPEVGRKSIVPSSTDRRCNPTSSGLKSPSMNAASCTMMVCFKRSWNPGNITFGAVPKPWRSIL